eukprot:85972-Prymnesium_polylepis.1
MRIAYWNCARVTDQRAARARCARATARPPGPSHQPGPRGWQLADPDGSWQVSQRTSHTDPERRTAERLCDKFDPSVPPEARKTHRSHLVCAPEA